MLLTIEMAYKDWVPYLLMQSCWVYTIEFNHSEQQFVMKYIIAYQHYKGIPTWEKNKKQKNITRVRKFYRFFWTKQFNRSKINPYLYIL